LALVSATGWPSAPFVAKLDAGTAAEEKILVGARSGTACSSLTRGYDGTTATSHSSGATVEHDLGANIVDDLNDHVYTTTRDDHTQYARTDGTRAFTGNVTVNGNLSVTGTVTGVGSYTRIYCNTPPTITTGVTTQITGNLTDATSGSSAPTASATALTITTAGIYVIHATILASSTNGQTGFAPNASIQKNGSQIRLVQGANQTSNGGGTSLVIADVVACAANDVITYWVECPVFCTISAGTNYTWLSAVLL
jgi:hypothetical protein